MKTKELVLAALLLALGLVLHSVTPPIFGGVKPDFLLATMFIAIISQPKLSNTVLIGFVAGILAAMTTGFPGGQIPNVIDKMVAAFFTLGALKLIGSYLNSITVSVLAFVGTIVSGIAFLGSALLIVGLPAPFTALFIAVVLPAAIANIVVTFAFYKIYAVVYKPSDVTLITN